MISLIIDNIKIVSENRRLGYSKHGAYLTSEYRKCKEYIIDSLRSQYLDAPIEIQNKLIILKYHVNPLKDVDNCTKLIFDSMQDAGIIDNDRHIEKYLVVKIPTKAKTDTLKIDII